MLSGFFGLIAMDTSAGLMAEGSVIRTTCCAWVNETVASRKARIFQRFIRKHFPVNVAVLSIFRTLLHLTHKERTEFVNHVDCVAASSQALGVGLWPRQNNHRNHTRLKTPRITRRFVVG